jgi:tryptophan synthase alpha chain
MGSLRDVFRERSEQGGKLFVPYLTAGDPDIELSRDLIRTVDEAGADIIELGIPFSDPLADGPTIQKAVQRSIDGGIRIQKVFELVEDLRTETDTPIVFMTYYNSIFRYGESDFIADAADSGADGVLVVDLPPEEGLDFFERAPEQGLDTALLATPTTPTDRMKALSELATGFLYYVMVTGVTGVRSGYDEDLAQKVEEVGINSQAPTVMGFGISDIAAIEQYLDPINGVVSGSHLIEGINENLGDRDAILTEVRDRAERLANPLHEFESSEVNS